MKHTQGKWEVEGFCIKVGDKFDAVIAECKDLNGEALANAKRIVHCVNNFDELLEALKAMKLTHGMHGPCEQNSCSSCDIAYKLAQQAIAKGEK